jgi:hypothetical protein
MDEAVNRGRENARGLSTQSFCDCNFHCRLKAPSGCGLGPAVNAFGKGGREPGALHERRSIDS